GGRNDLALVDAKLGDDGVDRVSVGLGARIALTITHRSELRRGREWLASARDRAREHHRNAVLLRDHHAARSANDQCRRGLDVERHGAVRSEVEIAGERHLEEGWLARRRDLETRGESRDGRRGRPRTVVTLGGAGGHERENREQAKRTHALDVPRAGRRSIFV